MKRKILSALLALVLLLGLAACGAKGAAADAEGQSNTGLTVVTTLFPARCAVPMKFRAVFRGHRKKRIFVYPKVQIRHPVRTSRRFL